MTLSAMGLVDGSGNHATEFRIGRREIELPILADQLVAELRVPRLQRVSGHIVRHNAVGANQQQGIGFGGRLAVDGSAFH